MEEVREVVTNKNVHGEGERDPQKNLEKQNNIMIELTTPQEVKRLKGERSSIRHLDFREESSNKNLEYMGPLVTLKRFDKDFARYTIAKFLENVMCKENRR